MDVALGRRRRNLRRAQPIEIGLFVTEDGKVARGRSRHIALPMSYANIIDT